MPSANSMRGSKVGVRGVTLLEILLVLALLAMIVGGVISGSGMLGSTRQRAASTLVLTAVRQAMTHANSVGLPVRLVFDFEQNRISLEETRARMLRTNSEEEEDDLTGGAAAATEAEKLAAEESERILDGPREPPAQFSAVAALGVDPDDAAGGRPLGGDVRFISVQTEHDPTPRTEGRAYLYFWPGGGTEKAVITLGRPDSEPVSILVSALNGRARIQKGEIELDRPLLDGDFGERDVE